MEPLKTHALLSLEPTSAEAALFDGQIEGLVATFYNNERPLAGLAGWLDWHFRGAISTCLKKGFLTGNAGECAYLPLTRAGHTYHVILVGAGPAPTLGGRNATALPPETLKILKKNLTSLKLARVGFSRSDWGGVSDEFFAKNLKGIPVCVLR